MAKGEAAKTNRLLDEQRQREQGRDYGLSDTFQRNLGDAQTRSTNLFNAASGGFGDFAAGGGVSPDLAGDVRGAISGYKEFAGGRDPSSKLYQNLIDTGGYTPEDIRNMTLSGTAGVPQFFGNLKDEMARQNSAQGGLSPGYNASVAAAARDASRGAADASLNTSLGINNLVRSGRISGAEGLARNKLAGLGGATGAALSQGGMEMGGREFGVGGEAALRGQVPGEVSMYGNETLGAEGLGNQGIGQNLGTRAAYNPNISLGDRLMQGLGAAGGLAGGLSGMGFKPFGGSPTQTGV